MDADHGSELERLRARAYGPNADIGGDPAAVARLRELEDLERMRTAPLEAETEADPDGVADVPRADPEPEETEPEETEPTPRRPILRSRRRVWVAALAVAGIVALTSAATAAGVSFTAVDRTSGIAQTDTLTADPDAELGSAGYLGLDPEQTRGFADYYGLTVFSGVAQIDSEGNQAECLIALNTTEVRDADSPRSAPRGTRFGGCGAGPFPASVEFIVTSSFPEPFRARYPVGTAMQFVLDDGDVGVFSADG
ncbi:hypothetical protein P2P98_15265 [Microbacterium sp. Kw_RZR3]|jgi:hypothetical protein|uniref:hypothetical protein n=1 Tax=Microbacterium sp. Kw_RZR3 TaxID=3032903 RepID=UPI0023D9CF1B|nr:hypothetical protein [Microbacterium sp. Kw_RZR3]MDF2047525.1 hypothetical protein [Microbacterium sp. Kw_RZR3]